MMNLTKEEKSLFEYIDGLIAGNGCLEYNFNDTEQYEFAVMLTKKSVDAKRYPGAIKFLELLKADHIQNGFVSRIETSNANGWVDMYTIPGLGLSPNINTVASDGIGTVVGGYSSMNLGLFVQNNSSKNIVAHGANNDFAGKLLTVNTGPNPQGSSDMDVTAYLHYSFTGTSVNEVSGSLNGSSGVVKRSARAGAASDPVISAPVRLSDNPYNPNAINIGLGRPWTDQGKNSKFDYAWNEPNQAHPVGKIPFIGNVVFSEPIKSPLTPQSVLILDIYVADKSGGGGAKLDAQDMTNVYSKFFIDPGNPNNLKWHLPPGQSVYDPGNPIAFGNVTWNTDIEAYFYCGITVVLQSGNLGFAAVQSKTTPDEDTLDGILEIMPIEFVWHCIAEGTMITMADGSLKPIEFILAGEKVKCESKEGTAEVTWTNKGHHKGHISRLKSDNGKTIITTDNHIFLNDSGPVAACDLVAGDSVKSIDGDVTIISAEHKIQHDGMLYNLGTREFQNATEHDGIIATFFANNFLVGDMNAQRAIRYTKKNDIGWLKKQVPAYLHKDVESFLEDKRK